MSDKKIDQIRRDYGVTNLSREQLPDDPMQLFQQWMAEVIKTNNPDPTAMVLATVDSQGLPDTRVVLLKDTDKQTFRFFTNYDSEKAHQLLQNTNAALNFYWPVLARQVRIRGKVSQCSAQISDQYFASRPRGSQISATISAQSHVITDRESLQRAYSAMEQQFADQVIPRPDYWGGYQLTAQEIEFWQGRDNRLHDRFRYQRHHQQWVIERLAP